MVKGAREDVELLRDLRVAHERGQLELYYQPKIHAPTGEITGAEAGLAGTASGAALVGPAIVRRSAS